MSYDKGKTIKEYMGGGYAQPMKYQTGGYIPGISRALYGANLNRRVGIAQDEQRQQAKALEKQEKRRGLFGKLGSLGGTIAGGVLATALAPVTGGASLLAGAALAKGLGSAGGSFLGEKLAEGTTDTSRVGRQSSTGLLDSGFEELGDIKREASKGILGRSLATGVKTGLMAGGADYLKGLTVPKDIAPPSMNIPGADAEMLGDVQIPGIEDLLSEQMTTPVSNAGSGLMLGDVQVPTLPSALSDIDFTADQLFQETYGKPTFDLNQGGKVYGYEDGGEAMNFKKGYFDRDFPKDSFKAMIKEAVDRGEIDPREGLQHILNKQQKDFMKSQDDTSNVLYKQLEKSGYAGGGLINMLPFNRRIM